MNIMAVKLGVPGAIACGNLQMCISEIYGTGQGFPVTAEAFSQRLRENFELFKPATIYVDRRDWRQGEVSATLRRVLEEHCARLKVPVIEVSTQRYRRLFSGYGRTSAPALRKAAFRLNLHPRNTAEADAMALFHWATDGQDLASG